MSEELTVCDHRMGDGWFFALSYCSNLKILRIQSCMYIDENPGQDKHMGSCLMLEELHLARCQIQDKNGIKALFLVCKNIRGLFIEDCWGLDDSIFAAAVVCSIRHRIVGLCWLGVDGTCELMDDRRFFVRVVYDFCFSFA